MRKKCSVIMIFMAATMCLLTGCDTSDWTEIGNLFGTECEATMVEVVEEDVQTTESQPGMSGSTETTELQTSAMTEASSGQLLNEIDLSKFDETDATAMEEFGHAQRYVTMKVPYNLYCEDENYYDCSKDINWICHSAIDVFMNDWFDTYNPDIRVAGGLEFRQDYFVIMLTYHNFESTDAINEATNDFCNEFYIDWCNYIDDRCEELGYPVDRSKTLEVISQ